MASGSGRALRFQSTLPARGATELLIQSSDELQISIHAPRTGSDIVYNSTFVFCFISIHAPRTGSDSIHPCTSFRRAYFNPRSPHGERLYDTASYRYFMEISIHAPRTGSDLQPFQVFRKHG